MGQTVENLCNLIRTVIKTSVALWGAGMDNPDGQGSVAGGRLCEYQRSTKLTRGQSWQSFNRSTASASEVRPVMEAASLLSEELLDSAHL